WYGDTARYAGDISARDAAIEYFEVRRDEQGNEVDIPVPAMADPANYGRHASQDTHFLNFNIYAGDITELEHLRHDGLLDEKFQPIGPQALTLTQYLQQAAQQAAAAKANVSIRGPQGALDATGASFVPADTPLPYSVGLNNPTEHALGQIRIVTELDADL